jgi:hypothetical protein
MSNLAMIYKINIVPHCDHVRTWSWTPDETKKGMVPNQQRVSFPAVAALPSLKLQPNISFGQANKLVARFDSPHLDCQINTQLEIEDLEHKRKFAFFQGSIQINNLHWVFCRFLPVTALVGCCKLGWAMLALSDVALLTSKRLQTPALSFAV